MPIEVAEFPDEVLEGADGVEGNGPKPMRIVSLKSEYPIVFNALNLNLYLVPVVKELAVLSTVNTNPYVE